MKAMEQGLRTHVSQTSREVDTKWKEEIYFLVECCTVYSNSQVAMYSNSWVACFDS